MPIPAPHAHQVQVCEVSTGRLFHVWPVDARELVTHGDYQYATAEGTATADTPSKAAATPPPPPVRPIAEQLGEWSYRDLQTLAKRAGVNANQKQDALIGALVPHIAAKAISVEKLPPLALPAAQFPHAEA
jgi:hypothetical protein